MTIELPTEIWWKILGYLPSDNIIRLGPVNRDFLQIARESLYKNLQIKDFDQKTERRLRNLSSLSLGHYVRSLYIQYAPWPIVYHPRHGPAKRLLSAVDFIRALFKVDSEYSKQKKRIIQLILETAQTLENVQECELFHDYPFGFGNFQSQGISSFSLIHATAMSLLVVAPFRKTLTKLSLRLPTDTLHYLASVTLPSLEDLDVLLSNSTRREFRVMDVNVGHLALFILGLSRTLRILSISCHDDSLYLDGDFGRFFNLLSEADPFQFHLRSFSFQTWQSMYSVPNGTFGGSSMSKFIIKTGHHLRDLMLSHYPGFPIMYLPIRYRPNHRCWISYILAPGSAQGQLTCAQFSSLKSLKLSGGSLHPDNLTGLSTLLSSVARQLQSFVLEYEMLGTEEVIMLVRALSCSPSPLRHLGMEVKDLDPYIFTLLASEFPQLESLELGFEVFSYASVVLQSSMTVEEVQSRFPNMPVNLVLFFVGLLVRNDEGLFGGAKGPVVLLSAALVLKAVFLLSSNASARRLFALA
ncbi:hypothetical protein D9757_005184 [Collybiopsis confluens]|uniref:F-box domain-containing protein n=1 Tax=Collybiopsis confluens TaxID=2823264 RepID=A0A8H5ME97_9AGAR|nr:hypothetical protein D9757_005184 [Collybiopsis confluens]